MEKKSINDFKKPTKEHLEIQLMTLAVEVEKVKREVKEQIGIGALSFSEYYSMTGVTEAQQLKYTDTHDPKVSTLLRMLEPFGYTLAVVPKKVVHSHFTEEEAKAIADRVKVNVSFDD